MNKTLNFQGFIKNVTYEAFLTENLTQYNLEYFDINKAKSYGLIKTQNTEIAYSKWVSPKRTRSYPFARIYNTYNSAKILTVIPVIKDEGADGDRDKIQYSTVDWMNLLNIYIVLAYYETADKNRRKGQENKNKLTNHKFNNDFVKEQIREIIAYRQSALHWNISLFETKFTIIFDRALNCYDNIASQTDVKIHSRRGMDIYIKKINDRFEHFKQLSLQSSLSASVREVNTFHKLEHLTDGNKATFEIKNYLGGIYYLTIDEVIYLDNRYIIQESKNSSRSSLPDLSDIQDGLFKLILFSNLESLILNNNSIFFTTKLKLTGKNVIDSLVLPAVSSNEVESFLRYNQEIFTNKQKQIIRKLAEETNKNQKIYVEINNNNL